jgi:SOS response regulatory protein OraA/RecX
MAERDPIELAARSLHYRDRSRSELDARLARAGIDDVARADALDTLERVGYVDDTRFAATRAAALAGRGYGDEAIRHDLAAHELGPEAIEAGLAALEPEATRAAALVERLGRTRKVAAQLARKGFGQDTLEAALGAEIAGDDAGDV